MVMGDGVFLTRLFVFLVIGWPALAVSIVYALRRPGITRPGMYLLKSLGLAYAISLLGPVAMILVFSLTGLVPEVATFYTLLLGVPVFAAVPVGVAIWVARPS